jgi:hypothetical protein
MDTPTPTPQEVLTDLRRFIVGEYGDAATCERMGPAKPPADGRDCDHCGYPLHMHEDAELLKRAATALSAYQQRVQALEQERDGLVAVGRNYADLRDAAEAEVERLTKERDEYRAGNVEIHAMLHDAEESAAAARRAAFAEAAQYIRDLSAAAGRDTPDMQALADLVERLAAQAVPPGFCASCTPDIRPQCESASWCMRPRAVPPGAAEAK